MKTDFVKLSSSATLAFAVSAFTLFTSAPTASAQRLLLETSALSTDYYLLKNTLVGGGLEMAVAPEKSKYALLVGVGRYRGHAMRTAVVCAGLVPPGTCQTPELVRDDAKLWLVSLGGSAEVFQRNRLSLGLIAFANGGNASSKSRGQQTGKTLGGTSLMWGLSAGVRGAYAPFARIPLAIEARATVGDINSVFDEEVLDGYNIFQEHILFRRLTLGLSYRLPLKAYDLTPREKRK